MLLQENVQKVKNIQLMEDACNAIRQIIFLCNLISLQIAFPAQMKPFVMDLII